MSQSAAIVWVAGTPTAAKATTGGRQARINGLLEQLKANNRAELVNAAAIYAAARSPTLCKLF